MLNLSQHDHMAIKAHALSIEQIEAQLQQLRNGVSPLHLARPCHISDGIRKFTSQELADYQKPFHRAHAEGRISKFIPASGAATRMFKDLLQFVETADSLTPNKQNDRQPPEVIAQAWERLHEFPFLDDLQQHTEEAGMDFNTLYDSKHMAQVFHILLHTPGLGYANLPKALLPFHHYLNGTRTSLEEHVREAIMYAETTGETIRIHLTVSAQFKTQVSAHLETIQQNVSASGMNFELSVSIQKPSTDTIALDANDQIFRNDQGDIIFRPGGHGALLENLNDCQGDIVCISNIDNVVPDYLKESTVQWRKALGGYLILVQERVFHHLQQLASPHPEVIKKAKTFIEDQLKHQFSESFDSMDIQKKANQLKQLLHRPIRVCGVVPNTGDAGGGPFWVEHANGSQSRQIVEQSQADPTSELQQQLFNTATHFNPVDLVCGVRDYRGVPFNLLEFSDPNTSFISHKTYQGRPLKALEWPGLWNGGMANWNTLFVEVPRSTFNPVKTLMDWLHPHHQPQS